MPVSCVSYTMTQDDLAEVPHGRERYSLSSACTIALECNACPEKLGIRSAIQAQKGEVRHVPRSAYDNVAPALNSSWLGRLCSTFLLHMLQRVAYVGVGGELNPYIRSHRPAL